MTLKSAAFFALIGMALLTVVLALDFIRGVGACFWSDCCERYVGIANSLAGKPECDRVSVRVPPKAALNVRERS